MLCFVYIFIFIHYVLTRARYFSSILYEIYVKEQFIIIIHSH